MTDLKKLIRTKFQQDYLPELFPIVPLDIYGKPWRWGESHPTTKNVFIYPTRKIPLMKFTLLSKVSLLPHEIVSFYLICSCSHGYCIIFSFQASCVVLILINRCLLNVVFSMTNALNDQSSSKQNFCPLHLSILMRVFLFF